MGGLGIVLAGMAGEIEIEHEIMGGVMYVLEILATGEKRQ